ncbi:Epimerase family protein [Ruegeria denitrificans]|uniref:Epimerase family protein n=1 Tax=Ruegeria denitrificans TaxID=1715692 RepID=A0A0P1ISC9_9RHOB|nr:TIGR01777 family oxidoreductase [Ruegeria denitrificans]CUK18999.1 Epimerase family protein [Ruegeria denitrificans]
MNDTLLWTLISIQVFMGAFDTLVHHEGTERLAWRPSQKTELRLHGVRNLLYAVIFLSFGWFEPHGLFTIALSVFLAFEVLITLWDFVEEDMTRRLPGSERINHTLLALNYGAILALAAPYLWAWSALPTALVPANYGWWTVMATFSAIGVVLFGMRDLTAAGRCDRLMKDNPLALVAPLPPRQRVLVTGGTGFIGRRLVQALVMGGHYVTVLTRDPRNADAVPHPVRIISSLNQIHNSDRFDAIVNLAGEPVANGLWTTRKRARIINSRVDLTSALEAVIERLDHHPECLINGSAIGWYGLRQDEELTEASQPTHAFVHQVCESWEDVANKIAAYGVRVVTLRIGLVLGVEDGMLARLLTPFEFCGGGILGNGQQWMSWIECDDMIRVIAITMARQDIKGPVNATAPEPVRNIDFTRALAQALNRPAFLQFPGWLLRGLGGEMARETMLGGQRVMPELLRRKGFDFVYPELAPALRAITGAHGNPDEDGYDSAIWLGRADKDLR